MESTRLLPQLQKLPGGEEVRRRTLRQNLQLLLDSDKTAYATEAAIGSSAGLWYVFNATNIDDATVQNLTQAYQEAYPNLAAEHSLHEHWNEMIDRGQGSMDGFLNGIKGKAAEFDFADRLREAGYSDVSVAADPTQPIWDISSIDPDGHEVLWQIKTGGADRAGEIMDLMDQNPGVHYGVSTELFDRINDIDPSYIDSMADIGSNVELVDGAQDGLSALSANMGLDIPDGIGELLPYAGIILGGARLIYGAMKSEKEFAAADRTTKNKMQVVSALTTMSRMGVSTVMATVGGAGGTMIGSAVPILGNIFGGIAGTIAGAGMGMYLNKHLQPHMLDLALDITNLTHDDLFYYKNQTHIDQVALSFRERRIALGTA